MPLNYLKSHAYDIGIWLGQPTLASLCLVIALRQPVPFPINVQYYIIGICIFMILSLFLQIRKKSIWLAVCNYVCIGLVLMGRPLTIPINLCLLIYPLIVNIIFRGKLQNVYVLMVMAFVISICIMVFDKYYGSIFIFELILGVANIYRQEEDKMIVTENKIDDSFDNLIRSRNIISHAYEINRVLITEWNEAYRDVGMTDIETYYRSNHKFYLINSAWFTWNRRLYLDENTVERLSGGMIVIEDRFDNGGKIQYLVPVKVDAGLYVVRYTLYHRKGISVFEKRGMQKTLIGVSGKLVNILALVHKLKKYEASYIEETKDKKKYIDTSINTMHFIRNRLTSIANLVEFLKLPEEERKSLGDRIVTELYKGASHDYGQIKRYADDLLNKEKYPFGDREKEEVPIQTLYVYLAESVEHHLHVYVETHVENDEHNPNIQVNYFELKTILTDWISNMEKYGSRFGVDWNLDSHALSIIFRNMARRLDCEKAVEALTNDNVETRHTRKQTFGINIIRENAVKNNITISATVENTNSDDFVFIIVTFIIPVKNEE